MSSSHSNAYEMWIPQVKQAGFSSNASSSAYLELMQASNLWQPDSQRSLNLLLRWIGDDVDAQAWTTILAALLVESQMGRVRLEWSYQGLRRVLKEHWELAQMKSEERGESSSLDFEAWMVPEACFDEAPSGVWIKVLDEGDPLPDDAEASTGLILVQGEKQHLYLQRNHLSEQGILAVCRERFSQNRQDAMPSVKLLKELFIERPILPLGQQFHRRQAIAAIQGSRSPFFLLSGGPGTGKTSVLLQLLRVILHRDMDLKAENIALVAPTGRAKSRMQESLEQGLNHLVDTELMSEQDRALLSVRASTLHQLLGFENSSNVAQGFLPQRLIVVDEASMMDLHIFARLLERLRPDARLILLGDVDQLPSVDHGAVLSDLSIASDATLSSESSHALETALKAIDLEMDEAMVFEGTAELGHRLLDNMVMLSHSYRSQKDILDFARKIQSSRIQDPTAHDELRQAFEQLQLRGVSDRATSTSTLLGEDQKGMFTFDLSEKAMTRFSADKPSEDHLLESWWDSFGENGEGSLLALCQRAARGIENIQTSPAFLDAEQDSHVLVSEQLETCFAKMLEHQVLCLSHHGRRGTAAVRASYLQYKRQQLKSRSRTLFQEGDRVMVSRNLHHLDLYNGDVGLVLVIRGEHRVIFKRGDRYIDQSLARLQAQLQSADAITVHKSQGSEYDKVLMLLPELDTPLLSREILYTGITRAKSLGLLVGDADTFTRGCQRSSHRPSAIGQWARREDS